MAFEVKDNYMHYSKKGDPISVWNISFEDPTAGEQYYAYFNDEGAYLIQRVTTSGTLKIYMYYASRITANYSLDITNRANLAYGEYYELFQQGI